MENTITLIAAISAFLTSIISIIVTLHNHQKQVKTETITRNRIDWIKDVRLLVMEFLTIYIDDSLSENQRNQKLILTKNKICLYLRKEVTSYQNLVNALNVCIDNKYDTDKCNYLIEKTQEVLSEVWIRTKMEAGITKREDNKYEFLFGNKQK